jgi:hypothetical protein
MHPGRAVELQHALTEVAVVVGDIGIEIYGLLQKGNGILMMAGLISQEA